MQAVLLSFIIIILTHLTRTQDKIHFYPDSKYFLFDFIFYLFQVKRTFTLLLFYVRDHYHTRDEKLLLPHLLLRAIRIQNSNTLFLGQSVGIGDNRR
ncbi:uncharacterized protein BDW43DRAFT_149467 [Aspergillus alliaceus]|uniref:uncharacterized protein n=1 Tax=Petromyces alliaceus TaxID=209559 RepID=UPI0012A3CFAF|nr:uncharacterized protein BDW43DRAFT_149467 [Aspergillus alliaceus]KAB8237876.1 hypothetical protein BDW43DRAFT_149467 [Aspergillus alliaceus]